MIRRMPFSSASFENVHVRDGLRGYRSEPALENCQPQRTHLHPAEAAGRRHPDLIGGPSRQTHEHPAQLLGDRQVLADFFGHLATEVDVDGREDQVTPEGGGDGLGDMGPGLVLGFDGRRTEVRCEHDLGQFEERAFGQRFGGEDVERRPADVAAANCLDQGKLVDDPAARGVDDPHALLAFGQVVLAQQSFGVGGQRQMDGREVGALEHLAQLDELDPDSPGPVATDEGVVGDHLHAERCRPMGDQRPDPTQPDDAERLAVIARLLESSFGPRHRIESGRRLAESVGPERAAKRWCARQR